MVLNGRIWPGLPRRTALAIAGERILASGTDQEIRALAGRDTTVIDAGGGLVMPGFNDAHVHFLMGARNLNNLDLSAESTEAGVLRRIRGYARRWRKREWLVGRGWFYAVFTGGLPHRRLLDRIVPDRPVVMEAYDGHTTWVNGVALARAGITSQTPNPPRGEIQRDEAGEPTGVLKEAAMELMDRVIPAPSGAQELAGLTVAMRLAVEAGLTSAQDAGTEIEQFGTYEVLGEFLSNSSLPRIRLRLGQRMEPGITMAEWERRLAGYEAIAFPRRSDPWLSGGIVKAFADGVIESGTAAMLAPYEGMAATDEGAHGYPQWEPGELEEAVRIADARGWQVQIHAIGDGAVRTALDAYQRAAVRNGPRDRRHRIEHIETIDAADIRRFGELGVVASMQPYHADPEPAQLDLYRSKIGPDRASRGWPWNSIRRAGGRLAFGSDWPIVSFDPFLGLNSAVNRTTKDGRPEGGWLPGERLALAEALAGYTSGSAWAAHQDAIKGTLEAGMLADVVILDKDLFASPPAEIPSTSVSVTILGGRIVYDRNSETSR